LGQVGGTLKPDIVPVTTGRQVRQFVELPYSLYANYSHWVPPLRRDEHRRLSSRHNAFFQHAEMDLWLASSSGRVTGRIAAIEDGLHDSTHHEAVTWFGFLEADTAETAGALLASVEQRARDRGRIAVRGPANPSLNESAGLLVDGFDEDPCVLMPYNPPSYPLLVEAAGYRKVKDLFAWDLDLTVPLRARITRLATRVAGRHGVSVRPLDLGAFERDLAIVQRIYREAWEDNWGFVPPTDAEVRQLAIELRPALDPEIVLFAEINGRAVGCAVAIPDLNPVLKRMKGRLLPFGFLHFLRRRAIVHRARVLLLGVVPDARRMGLYPLLIAELHRRGVARGYRRAELSWTLEDNDAINAGIEAAGGRRYKTYRLYEKSLR
jgi:GNAT superfamily N-acetyltransferase